MCKTYVERFGARSLPLEAATEVLRGCALARLAVWHALLSPDGVVGAYDRARWSVELPAPGLADGVSHPAWQWKPLCGQQLPAQTPQPLPPRHLATADCDLESALGFWTGERAAPVPLPGGAPAFVYLRGTCAQPAGGAEEEPSQGSIEHLLRGSAFEDLRATCAFGEAPFRVTLYASQAGLQTNLHADEHSGFLAQVRGYKRVVLIGPKAARPLRCATWGDRNAPVSRRSWYDVGVPDEPGWAESEPFAGLGAREVEVGPGEALFIPKGHFHDVLSRSEETLGVVLRCCD